MKKFLKDHGIWVLFAAAVISVALAAMSFGRGRRAAPVTYGKVWWRRLGLCVLVLLLGVCAELFASPWLLRLVLGRVLA